MNYPYDELNIPFFGIYWPLLIVIIFSFLCYVSRYIFRKNFKQALIRNIILLTLYAVVSCIGGTIMALFLALNISPEFLDRDQLWWRAEEPARHMIDELRYEKTLGKEWPKDMAELKQRFGKDIAEIQTRSTTNYLYDESTQQFYFLVQPSKYYVIVYTSLPKSDFGRYALKKENAHDFFASGGLYPPPVPGPWQELLKTGN